MIKFLLVGCGNFGRQYYSELCDLEHLAQIELVGVVTRETIPTDINLKHKHLLLDDIDTDFLSGIDFVVLATPASTHADLIEKFHAFCHLIVEKPLINNSRGLAQLKRLPKTNKQIYPAQIFRYHPIADWFKDFHKNHKVKIKSVTGIFINCSLPEKSFNSDPLLEMNHMIDLSSNLLNWSGFDYVYSKTNGLLQKLNCYPKGINYRHTYEAGFDSNLRENKRSLIISYETCKIEMDFVSQCVTIFDNDKGLEKILIKSGSLIKSMLLDIIESHSVNKKTRLTTFNQTTDIFDFLLGAMDKVQNKKVPKKNIAVIGGGVFGCCCALELASEYNVKLLEKNDDLLQEASYWNQWRHHSGFHYPLSHMTIQEIKTTKGEFESLLGDTIHKDIPAYYFVSATAQEIPSERYLSSCDLYNLSYQHVDCPEGIDKKSVSLSLLTDEGVYDIEKLRSVLKEKLAFEDNITILTGSHVNQIDLNKNNSKRVKYSHCDLGDSVEDFDYVVDCTNAMASVYSPLLKPEVIKVRYEVVELLKLTLPIEPCCLTVIDGPFVSLTSMGSNNQFLLSHRDHSVHSRSYCTEGPSVNDIQSLPSNRDNILRSAREYFPCLENASNISSFFAIKSISPYESEVWERPTIIRDNGFGVFSIIGGKILTAVSNAKDIRSLIS